MENQNRAVNKKGYISAIVVLLLINIFTLYMFLNERTQKTDLTSQKTELQHQFRDLSDTLNMRNTEVEQFMGKNAELDRAIAEKQEQMDAQKKEIQRLFAKNKMTQAELSKAKDLIAQYQASITDMTARVDQLTKENAELMASNQQLTTDLTTERSTTSQLTETNKGLSKKVEAGSLFQIARVEVDAVKTKGNGKEVEVRKAKAAQNLRIKFETGENRVLDPGTVPLYVRIINPKGETIAVADQGSGTIPAAETAEPIQYTKKADIDYNQTNKTVVVYWGKNIQQPGTYKVEVIQNGHVVGNGSVELS
jgi:regulatory protein YycI of two-component signal transduction system YycFG